MNLLVISNSLFLSSPMPFTFSMFFVLSIQSFNVDHFQAHEEPGFVQ